MGIMALLKTNILLVFGTLSICWLASHCYAATEPKEAIHTYLKAWTKLDLFSGVVLVAKDGEILLHKAYGKADFNKNLDNTCNTRFRIGSLTKAFTAMLVLQLEQQNLLTVTAPLDTFLPDYPRGDEITLEMLLHHRSGIVDHTSLSDYQTLRRTNLCPLEKTINTFKRLPLEFSPGTQFKYSNSNYILLGFIIEKVTQKPYADVLQSQILEPLGMERTGFEYHQHALQDMALGHKLEDNKIIKAEDRVMQNAHASGAIYSTARDLYTWDRALYTDKLVKKASLEKILDPRHDKYAYGWAKTLIFDKKVLAHTGETEGFKASIRRFIDDDTCIIVLSNFEHCPIDRISEDLAAIMFGQPYQLPKKASGGNEDISNYYAYVGRYQIKPGFVLTITNENNQLFCQPTGQDKLQLHPENATTFNLTEVDAKITFIKNSKGQATKLILNQKGKDIPAVKQ
jgi:CubicO group peptidase (beta-lactamase class C family)